ncbi:uncharacterized protein PGRI_000040 [Penicillium griseofulvum]|uniref:Uncharacterized protein n=1 Tax=Penicillium patulum TaxID=5078 RepID=A0A135LVF3_PENPA|nr:uncharacterized protein PGRI_000040 [Penicillium griseofulvum]KXG52954.1 hypothetical protein PGRI_000040 [Penicillium griseofulvum]
MKNVYSEHFKPFQDKLSLVLEHSRSHFRALAGRESFAGFLNVPLISDALGKTIEVMFEASKPCVLQLHNDEASPNINWLDVVKERNYEAEYKGNGTYHFHMRDRGVIVQLSAFQHNMVLSGLPRKLIQPWSYEKDVQTELNTLALTAEMTSQMNQLASEIIKANNTVLEEVLRRDRILRRNPQPSRRSAGSPFPLESAEEPANFMQVQIDVDPPDGMAIETQRTDAQASASKRGAGTRNFLKNKAWPAEVLKQLPLWFEDQVRKNQSQEEIAQNFHGTFTQKRTFHAIEAKVYFLTGKSPFRKRNKKTSRKRPVSLTPRSSPPPSQSSGSVDSTQQLISRSSIEVHALRLARNLLPYLSSENCEDGNLYALHGVQPVDPESETSDLHAAPEQDTVNQMSRCQRAPQERESQAGTSQNESPVRGSHQAEESPKAHPGFSDMVGERQPRNGNPINVFAATSEMGDTCLPRSSPLEPPRISEPIQSPIRHPSEDDATLEVLGQTLSCCAESSTMHMEEADTAHGNQSSERLSPQSSSRKNTLTRGSENEGSNDESHTESGLGALTVLRESMPFQVPQPSSAGDSTEHHPQNCGIDGPTTDKTERALVDEELIIRCLHEKSKAARSHRNWNDKDLDRLPEWHMKMKRQNLSKERLEVAFLRDFDHYRTSSAIDTACRKKRKADSRRKDVTSAPIPGPLPPVVPVVLDTTRVSQSLNAIIGPDIPSLHPSHTIAEPSNENAVLTYPPSERPRSPQLNRSQVLDNADRFSRNMPPPLHEGEEAVGQSSPAAVALESASEQMVCSTPENAEDTSTLGNRRHRVVKTPKPPSRFTAINGGTVHPTDPNVIAQLETNERDTPPDGQGSQRASKCVGQRRDGQNEPQKDGPQTFAGGRGRPNQLTPEHELASSNNSGLSSRTLEGAGYQRSLPIGTSDANIAQLGTRTDLQNTSQSQERDVDIPTPNDPHPTCQPNSRIANSQFCRPNSRSGASQTSGVPGSTHTGGLFTPYTSGPTYSDMRSEAVVPISVSASYLSSPTGLPHYPLHELQGRGAERYQGPPLPSLAQQMYRAGEPPH